MTALYNYNYRIVVKTDPSRRSVSLLGKQLLRMTKFCFFISNKKLMFNI